VKVAQLFFRPPIKDEHTGPAYAPTMLGRLQDRTGSPNLRTRVLAACVIIGLLVLTAPLAVLPLVHWLARFL